MKFSVFMSLFIVIITLNYNLGLFPVRNSYTDINDAIKKFIKPITITKKLTAVMYECRATKKLYTTLIEAAYNCLYTNPYEKTERWYGRSAIYDKGYQKYLRYLHTRKLDKQFKFEDAQLRRSQLSESREESELSDASSDVSR